jgi:hypothetical protein
MFHHLKFPENDLEPNSLSNIFLRVLFLAVLVTFLWDLSLFPSAVCFMGSLVLRGICPEYWTALLCSFNYASLYLYPQRGMPWLRLQSSWTHAREASLVASRTCSSTVHQPPPPTHTHTLSNGLWYSSHTRPSLFIRDYLVTYLSPVFQNRMLRRIFTPLESKWNEDEEICIQRTLITYTLHHILWWSNEGGWDGGAYSTHGTHEKCVRNYSRENQEWIKHNFRKQRVDVRIKIDLKDMGFEGADWSQLA